MDHGREERRLTTILGTWAAASVASGLVLGAVAYQRHNRQLMGFARQNVMWGAIDGAVAGLGWLSSVRRDPFESPEEADAHRVRVRRVLVINAAADVVYVVAGKALALAAWRTGEKRVAGVTLTVGDGVGIATQGAFLLALDSAFAYRLRDRT